MTELVSALVTAHPDPPTAGKDRTADWDAAQSFADFLPTARTNAGLWEGVYRRTRLPADLVARAAAVPGHGHLLVLSADWCGDASNIVPVLARLAEAVPRLDLRVLDRDRHLDLMDEHLTGGTARAIPAVMILDAGLVERAWWGPRPSELQIWFKTEGQQYDSAERYRRLRQWYARDHGRSTLDEVVTLLEHAATDD